MLNPCFTGFYDMFPPKNMNASIVKEESQSMQGSRNLLVAARDFAAGETIYKVRLSECYFNEAK